jgi:putative peptidoglycan binding protein
MPQHTVSQGETASKIASDAQLADSTVIWRHPSNRDIAGQRDPNLLYPGDELFVPEKEQKEVPADTGLTHRYKMKVPKNKLRLQMLDGDKEPIPEADYSLTVGDDTWSGQTSDDGWIMHDVPVGATSGTLDFAGRNIELEIGSLDPIEYVEGVKARLMNLGYKISAVDADDTSDEYKDAVKAFQSDFQLTVDGIVGPQTRGKLKDVYGC